MQLKMQALINFPVFYATVKSQKLPIKTAYKLAQLSRSIETELSFYQEKLNSIIKEYAQLDDNGNPLQTEDGRGIRLRPGTEPICFSAMQELHEIDVALPDIFFNLNEFDNVELTVEEMGALLPFLIE